jgi:hypothetical protein
MEVSATNTPALVELQQEGVEITIQHIMGNPHSEDAEINAVTLMLARPEAIVPIPDSQVPLESGDRLLLCGTPQARAQLHWTLHHRNVLRFLVTGEQGPEGTIWRWLEQRRRRT